jgi:hypothetical protein
MMWVLVLGALLLLVLGAVLLVLPLPPLFAAS